MEFYEFQTYMCACHRGVSFAFISNVSLEEKIMNSFYIGIKSCGCITAACVDRPEWKKDTAKYISEWIKEGKTVEHITEPPQLKLCKCGKSEELFHED